MRGTPSILVFSGSNRTGSWNTRLADAITRELASLPCETMRISLSDYPLPIYDGDLEAEHGRPENALALARLFDGHDGVIIASPEYNASMPPLVKNTIDWVSRISSHEGRPIVPYRGKVFGISAASPGRFGGMRSLIQLRATLVSCGALVPGEQLAVSMADKAFDEEGDLRDDAMRRQLRSFCSSVVELAGLTSRR